MILGFFFLMEGMKGIEVIWKILIFIFGNKKFESLMMINF